MIYNISYNTLVPYLDNAESKNGSTSILRKFITNDQINFFFFLKMSLQIIYAN